MLTTRGGNIEVIHHTMTTYAYTVWSLAQSGLTDEAKAAEDSLINIVNIAYSCCFENLNRHHENYPGIDWREATYKTGLQITTTKGFGKIKSSIDTVISNKVTTSSEIWFLIICPSEYKIRKNDYKGYRIKTITITDLIRQICSLDDSKLVLTLSEIRLKLHKWLPPLSSGNYKATYFQLPASVPAEFISHHNFWDHLEEKAEVPSTVFAQLSFFIQKYCKLPTPAKIIIAKIIQHSELPSQTNKPITIKLQNLYFHLNSKEQNELIDLLEVIEHYGFGNFTEKNHTYREGFDEVTISTDRYFDLYWGTYEPNYNAFTALASYYIKFHTPKELFDAFENSNLKLVS